MLIALGHVLPAQNSVLDAYEGFDYSQQALHNAARGNGFSAPWIGVEPDINGLVSWWPLDGSAGDVGPYGSHGTEFFAKYAATTNLPWSTDALLLDGSNHIELTAHLSRYLAMYGGTVAYWVRTSESAPSRPVLVISSTTIPRYQAALEINAGNTTFDVEGDVYTNGAALRGAGVADGNWHHVAMRANGNGDCDIFVDGARSATRNEGFFGYAPASDVMFIGHSEVGGQANNFIGEIDDLAIWNSALTDQEIDDLANKLYPPIGAVGTSLGPGPTLTNQSLSNSAYAGTGLDSRGGAFRDSTGMRAIRFLGSTIDTTSAGETYISFLARREDGTATRGLVMEAAEFGTLACVIGWTNTGNWQLGLRRGLQGPVMNDATTYFCVVQILRTQGGGDAISLKAYAPGETVHTDPSQLSGVGTAANNWTMTVSERSQVVATHLLITPQSTDPTNDGVALLDELRIGSTWETATSKWFGQGCGGLTIGTNNSAELGSRNFAVTLSGAQSSSPAFLFLGLSNAVWFSNLLPLDLTSNGAPGCFLLAAPDGILNNSTSAGGTASQPLPIPNLAPLGGLWLFAQWMAADSSTPNPLKAGFSNGHQILLHH